MRNLQKLNLTFVCESGIIISEKRKGVLRMMNWYSGFDALDAQEYDEIMEALAIADMEDEIAERAATDYFENELELDGLGH